MGRIYDLRDRYWSSEWAICPLDGRLNSASYHAPEHDCKTPASGHQHNHMRYSCGFEWTLPPRDKETAANPWQFRR